MRELLAFMTPEKKFQIGAKKDGCNLIKVSCYDGTQLVLFSYGYVHIVSWDVR